MSEGNIRDTLQIIVIRWFLWSYPRDDKVEVELETIFYTSHYTV